jgi:hypothetical protein
MGKNRDPGENPGSAILIYLVLHLSIVRSEKRNPRNLFIIDLKLCPGVAGEHVDEGDLTPLLHIHQQVHQLSDS